MVSVKYPFVCIQEAIQDILTANITILWATHYRELWTTFIKTYMLPCSKKDVERTFNGEIVIRIFHNRICACSYQGVISIISVNPFMITMFLE